MAWWLWNIKTFSAKLFPRKFPLVKDPGVELTRSLTLKRGAQQRFGVDQLFFGGCTAVGVRNLKKMWQEAVVCATDTKPTSPFASFYVLPPCWHSSCITATQLLIKITQSHSFKQNLTLNGHLTLKFTFLINSSSFLLIHFYLSSPHLEINLFSVH